MDDEGILSDQLSGRVRRPEDAGGKRLLETHFLLSPCSSGRVTALELPPLPPHSVLANGKEIPGAARAVFGGTSLPLFAGRRILWKGQPLLAVAGPDAQELEDWTSRVKLEITESDTETETAVDTYRMEKGSPKTGFKEAFQTIEESLEIPMDSGESNPGAITCVRDGSRYLIHAATAWPGGMRKLVARTLHVDRSHITVRSYPLSSGVEAHRKLWFPAVEACRIALLSWKARKSVRHRGIPHGGMSGFPGAAFHVHAAMGEGGRLLALEADLEIFTGLTLPWEEEFIHRVVLGLFGVHSCRNYAIKIRVIRTAAPPSTLSPAAGLELGFLAGELLASRIADNSLKTPGQWRREFLPAGGRFMGPGLTVGRDCSMLALLDRVLAQSDYDRKHAAYEQARLGRLRFTGRPDFFRGIGLGCAWFGNGFSSFPKELGHAALSVTMDTKGDLTVNLPLQSMNRALLGAWSMMTDSILGLEDRNLKFTADSGTAVMEPGPAILGRSTSLYTRLFELACNDLAKRRFRDPLPITVSRNRRSTARSAWDPQLLEGRPFDAVSWGVGVVEVSLSPRTRVIETLRVWLVVDGGLILDLPHAHSAVAASAEQSLGWCMARPNPLLKARIDVDFLNDRGRKSPRDVSTLPWLLLPSALIQALRQASGVNVARLPVMLEDLWQEDFQQ